jgi:hypothetical protein
MLNKNAACSLILPGGCAQTAEAHRLQDRFKTGHAVMFFVLSLVAAS